MSDPIEVLLKRLTAIARGRETPKGFHFFLQYGSAATDDGVTTVQISGTGWVLVSHRPAQSTPEEEHLISCYISTRDLRSFAKVLMDHPFWKLDTTRWEPDEGETNIHMRLMDTGRGFAWDTQVWSKERQRQRHLEELIGVVNLVIHTASEGAIAAI